MARWPPTSHIRMLVATLFLCRLSPERRYSLPFPLSLNVHFICISVYCNLRNVKKSCVYRCFGLFFYIQIYIFDLYNKMQLKRIEVNKKIPNPKQNYEYEFKSLIESINKNGFYKESALELNKNFEVFDGAHRLSCAIAFNIKKLPVKFSKKYINNTYDYSINWFRKNGLGYLEPYIINKYNKLIDKKIII